MNAPHRTRMLWLAGLLHGFTHVYHVALIPLYLLIQRDLRCESIGQVTSLVTIMMAAYFLPSYAVGILADRMNRNTLLGLGLAVNAAGFIALAFAPNYPAAVAAVVVAGLGGSCYHPAATAMIARLCPENTGRALGLVGIGAAAGFFAGPLYCGWRATLLETSAGAHAWRQPVLELGLLGLLAAGLFVALADRERPAPVGPRPVARPDRIFPTATLWGFFIACSVAFSLRDFAGSGAASLGSLFLQKAHGFDASMAGMALSGLFLASGIGNPLFGGLSDRGRKRWLTVVILTGAGMIALFPHLPARWTIPAFIVFGFFFQASYPMVEAALMQSMPDAVRGRVFGLFITVAGPVGNLAHGVVGAQVKGLGEAAHETHPYHPLYGLLAGLAVLSLAGLPCLHAIRRREHTDESRRKVES